MSYRKRILRRLKHFYDEQGPGDLLLLDPIDIIGKPGGQKYVAAVNQLMEERLIYGVAAGERPAFRLNPDRIEEVKRELRWYRDPALQFVVGTLLAVGGLVWAIITFIMER
jgi:hypothetical protein